MIVQLTIGNRHITVGQRLMRLIHLQITVIFIPEEIGHLRIAGGIGTHTNVCRVLDPHKDAAVSLTAERQIQLPLTVNLIRKQTVRKLKIRINMDRRHHFRAPASAAVRTAQLPSVPTDLRL